MAGLSDLQNFIVGPSSVYQDAPTYGPPTPVTIANDPNYWGGSSQDYFTNPSFGVDTSGLKVKTGFEPPSLLDAIKEGLYKGLTGAGNPLSSVINSTTGGTRMAGTATETMSDPLKKAIADIIQTQINTRPVSIYSPSFR